MKKISLGIVFLLISGACQRAPQTIVSFHTNKPWKEHKVALITPDTTYHLILDSTRSFSLSLPDNFTEGYGSLNYGRLSLPIFMEIGKSFDLFLQLEGRRATPVFTGKGAAKNEYLNHQSIRKFRPDFRMDETAFLRQLEGQENEQRHFLDSMGFGESFRSLESKRLHYAVYSFLPWYPSYHTYYVQDKDFKSSPAFYEKLHTEIREEKTLQGLPEYQNAWIGKITVLAQQKNAGYNAYEYLKNQLACIGEEVSDPLLTEYLCDHFITEYVRNYGMEHWNEINEIYLKKVTDPDKRARFKAVSEQWLRLKSGKLSPEFHYSDINGKKITLSDFAGKYVYISVWASWCEPCRKELPYLRELEDQMTNKNICFVGISCDWDKTAWVRMVKEKQIGGIQLHTEGDWEFLRSYMIRNIPRFVLVDREGKIINSNMTRPSDPETLETLNVLEGILNMPNL